MARRGYHHCLVVTVGLLCCVCGICAVEYLTPFLWYSGDVRVNALTEKTQKWIQLQSEPRQNFTLDVSDHDWAGVVRLNTSWGTRSGIENKSVLVSVSENDVSVYVSASYNAFTPLPIPALGTKYIVSSCPPRGDISVLVIATHRQTTDVDITFRLQGSVTYGDRAYSDGDTLRLRLEEYQTFTIKSNFDLTGTIVITTQTVAVFSGTILSPRFAVDYDQLLPVQHHGQEYIVAVDNNAALYQLQIVGEHSDTQIMFNNGSTVAMAGGRYRQTLAQNETLHFSTSRPVMTMLCRKSALYSGSTIVPPVSLYIKQSILNTRYKDTLKILAGKDVTDIQMRTSLSTSQTLAWEDIPDTAYKVWTWGSDLAFDRVSITTNINFTLLLFQDFSTRNGGYVFRQRALLDAYGSTPCSNTQNTPVTYITLDVVPVNICTRLFIILIVTIGIRVSQSDLGIMMS